MGRGGAFRLHNNIGASETVEGRENAAEGGSRPSAAESGRQGLRRILTSFFWLFAAPFCLYYHSAPICFQALCPSVFSASDSVSPCSLYSSVLHPDLLLSLSVLFFLTYGYLTVSFSFCHLSYSLTLPLSFLPPSFSPIPQFQPPFYFDLSFPCTCTSSVFFWCEDASTGGALGPRSQDARLRSWRWGRSRGLS